MQNQNNFKKHEQLKKKLKIVGIIMVATGLALTIAGFVDFFKTIYFNFIGNCQVPQKADIEKMA